MTDNTTADEPDEQGAIERRLDNLETQLEAQQETIEHQQARIEEQAAIIEEQREQLDDGDDGDVIIDRRTALQAGGVLGLLGLGAGTASAAGDSPTGQVGTDSKPLNKLYTAELYGSDGSVKLGANLDTNGNNIERPSKSVSSATTINAGDYFVEGDTSSSGFTITLPGSPSTGEEHIIKKKNGSNSLTIDGNGNNIDGSSSVSLSNDNDAKKVVWDGSEWQTQSEISSGGSSTSKLETSTLTAFQVVDAGNDISDNGSAADDAPNIVGGDLGNHTSGGPTGATIAGGGRNISQNRVTDDYTFIGGGSGNEATGGQSTIAGGSANVAGGTYSAIPGGLDNEASGGKSFAAGAYAKAASDNTFVWNDGSGESDLAGGSSDKFSSDTTTNISNLPWGPETFSVKAKAGVRFITSGDNTNHAYIDGSGNFTASGNVDAQGGTVENTATESSLTIQNDTNDKTANSYEDLTLKTVDTGNNSYPGDIILDADPNNNDSRNISLQTGGTERATVNSNGLAVTSGSLDAQGGTVENTTSGGLTVKTNDNGNLTLDPGSNNELTLSNQSTNTSGSLLAIKNGAVVEATSKTLSDVGGSKSVSTGVTTKQITSDEYFVVVDVSSSNQTITLPDSPSTGEEHVIQNDGSNRTKVEPGSGDNLNGSSYIYLNNDRNSVTVFYDGSGWETHGHYRNGYNTKSVTGSGSTTYVGNEDYEVIAVDTSSNSETINIDNDTPRDGRHIRIVDTGGNAGSNNISIGAVGSSFTGPSSTTISTNNGYREYVAENGKWREVGSN